MEDEQHDLYIVVFETMDQLRDCAYTLDLQSAGLYITLKKQPMTILVDIPAFDRYRNENGQDSYKYCYGLDFLKVLTGTIQNNQN